MIKKILLSIIILSIIATGSLFTYKVAHKAKQKLTSKIESKIIAYNCAKNETAYTALTKSGHTAQTKDYSFGKMIVAIDNILPENNKYWLYSINGQEATISADTYHCQNNEQIKWELK